MEKIVRDLGSAIIFCPSERCGSTWLMHMISAHPLIETKTEPIRQQLPFSNPIHPFSEVGSDLEDVNRLFAHQAFAKSWWSSFDEWVRKPNRLTLFKETNIFFRYGWVAKNAPINTRFLIHNRDIRAIVASFKRRDLYARWGYEQIAGIIEKTIRRDRTLNNEYGELLSKIDKGSSVDVLTFFYALNANEILKATDENAYHVLYERAIENPFDEIENIFQYFGLPSDDRVNRAIEDTLKAPKIGHDMNIRRRTIKPDWPSLLTLQDLRRIEYVLSIALDSLPVLREKHEVGIFELHPDKGTSLPTGAIQQNLRTDLKPKHDFNRLAVIPCQKERRKIIEEIQSSMITIPSNGNTVNLSSVLVDNSQYASFMNWITSHGIPNIIQSHYFLLNETMTPNRGARILRGDTNSYGVLKGFEDHPANWITYLGSALFCKWVGGRLSTPQEYNNAVTINLPHMVVSGENVDHAIGDTRPVRTKNNEGYIFHDLGGNLFTWTSQSPADEEEATIKIVKGGAWNKARTSMMKDHLRSIFFTARSIGVRTASDSGLAPLGDSEFADFMNDFVGILVSGKHEGKELYRNIDTLLSGGPI